MSEPEPTAMKDADAVSPELARARSAYASPGPSTARDRFLAACHCQAVDRPPVWLMRQAGRALPEYRALKERYTFLELVRTPELAVEVTLQPVRRFGFDAAILFSDILVVPEAMGQGYSFGERGGVRLEFAVRGAEDLERLDEAHVAERTQYVAQALRRLKSSLNGQTALLGFSGSPWTLANFMLEGGSAPSFTRARDLFHREPAMFGRLMDKLTRAVMDYLRLQIEAGADAVQLFDTLGGLLPAEAFEAASGWWLKEIIGALKPSVPVIVFSKGVDQWDTLVQTGARVLGVDWTAPLAAVRARLPAQVAVQGNLNPALLRGAPEAVAAATRDLLDSMRGQRGHIVNLGHGVPPDARLESIASLVETVRGYA